MGKEYTPYKMNGHTLPGINQRLDDHPAPTRILPILAIAGKALLTKKVTDTIAPSKFKSSPAKDRESRLRKRANKQRSKANVHVEDFSEKGEKKYQKHQGKYKKLLAKADKISSSKE